MANTPKFSGNAVITLNVTANPKKAGSKSYPRFNLYKPGITVDGYRAAVVAAGGKVGLANADLSWDSAPTRGYITIAAPPAPKPATAAKAK